MALRGLFTSRPPAAVTTEIPHVSQHNSGAWIIFSIAFGKLILDLATSSRYGYFGDELYYLACADHLDWGFVDQPPVIVVLAFLVRHTLGTSLFAIHLLPALAGAGLVVLTGMISRELGGGRFAQGIAALCAILSPTYLILGHLFTMNIFEPVIWMACSLVLISIIKTGNQKLWLWFGVLAGVGLETKYSTAVFLAAAVFSLVLTKERNSFRSKWFWIAVGIAFVIFLPNLLWNVHHHWPFLELMHNIKQSGRDVALGPVAFITQQILTMNPATFPIWLAGLLYLLISREGRDFQLLGWIFFVIFLVFLIVKGKDYYVAPIYPVALGAGAIVLERAIFASGQLWLRPMVIGILVAGWAQLAPLGIPILPIEKYIQFQNTIPYRFQVTERSHEVARLPHHYAWQFGWTEMVAATARVYNSLPAESRAKTAIFGSNFAEAGAVDLFGPQYGLPKSIGVHQNYWFWGPRDYTGEIMIILGQTPETVKSWCDQVEVGEMFHHPYAQPWENRPIIICRGFKGGLRESWPKLKAWR